MDVAACHERGVAVCNICDWSVSVPEHVFALLLALRRQLPRYQRAVAAGQGQASLTYGFVLPPLPVTLSGSVMGLIGYGALGGQVAALARAFGMTPLIAERREAASVRAGRTLFGEVLARSDVLVILCPLTAETRDLIGVPEMARLPAGALVINCARRHRERGGAGRSAPARRTRRGQGRCAVLATSSLSWTRPI
ncbi:NAD(P)-dependent oxidoreductase [Deinococcus alpinitundrae]|uniref:NAD(P)-dependent oxidoreductase n=1 Tax=Deinococcus alpinitundrae TaxID=468913 RepID=UPI00192A5CB0|nr:NAD(P)-dependent oxidoreductase [Deinococcus alpinitundrae]